MFLLTGLTLLLGLSRSEGSPDVTRMNDIDRQISDLEQFLKSPDHQQQSRNDIVSAWSNLGEKIYDLTDLRNEILLFLQFRLL